MDRAPCDAFLCLQVLESMGSSSLFEVLLLGDLPLVGFDHCLLQHEDRERCAHDESGAVSRKAPNGRVHVACGDSTHSTVSAALSPGSRVINVKRVPNSPLEKCGVGHSTMYQPVTSFAISMCDVGVEREMEMSERNEDGLTCCCCRIGGRARTTGTRVGHMDLAFSQCGLVGCHHEQG